MANQAYFTKLLLPVSVLWISKMLAAWFLKLHYRMKDTKIVDTLNRVLVNH